MINMVALYSSRSSLNQSKRTYQKCVFLQHLLTRIMTIHTAITTLVTSTFSSAGAGYFTDMAQGCIGCLESHK